MILPPPSIHSIRFFWPTAKPVSTQSHSPYLEAADAIPRNVVLLQQLSHDGKTNRVDIFPIPAYHTYIHTYHTRYEVQVCHIKGIRGWEGSSNY